MDIVGGVRIVDGSEAKIVSGIDDRSRFVVSARVVARATARPVCDALMHAMGVHGVPSQILTDNGKVFTARFGPGRGRCCSHERGLQGITRRRRAKGCTRSRSSDPRSEDLVRREFRPHGPDRLPG